MTRAVTTPVRREAAPNSLLRSEAGTIMLAAVPPPRPATTLASPVALNSRFQSRSWLAAISRPARFMITTVSAKFRGQIAYRGRCRHGLRREHSALPIQATIRSLCRHFRLSGEDLAGFRKPWAVGPQ